MALLETIKFSGKCPKCNSLDVEVSFKRIHSSKNAVLMKKWIECKNCGYKGWKF
jgi:predicted Zn-ribbon and HTH transcriptional regulator